MSDLRVSLTTALAERYALDRELGRGGMATVFLAQDLKHERPVALKVLHPELAAVLGPERFQREIRLAARLQHPHILTVLDSGVAASQLWFTMPYVEGESLRERLNREKQIAVGQAIRIVREAALGLEYAHEHGVVHRDIKPENILLTKDGSTLVADFGIARAISDEGKQLTETGLAIGTPAYMSPEQATGERDLDARTDVYSLGCVLYELLAGEPPFTGATPQAVMVRAMTETPRAIHAIRESVPTALDRTIARAMSRTPADRFASMAEFAQALESYAAAPLRTGDQPRVTGASSVSPRRRPVLLPALAIGFLLGLGVLFAWKKSRGTTPIAEGPRRVAVLPFENLGDSADQYFADGVTDAVRGKLTGLPELQVTARFSSGQYAHTTKSPAQIAQELGVQYLLTGTVRWEKGKGTSKVLVTPELIDASTSSSKWQQPFDAPLTDVFQVQSEIAGRVAQALDVALGATERQQLAERPTQNVDAYEAFLQGDAASSGLGTVDPPSLRRAMAYYEQAVALDSGFALAWARLSIARSIVSNNGLSSPELKREAGEAAQRAITLAPNLPASHHALGIYLSNVLDDPVRARAEYQQGLRLAPNNDALLAALAQEEQTTGEWESAIQHFQQAARIDPRSVDTLRRLARALLWMRRYPEAVEVADRGLALSPTNTEILETKVMTYLARGDLPGARAVITAAPKEMTPIRKVADLATYWDLYWALDKADQELVLRLRPSEFDDDVATWALVQAQLYAIRGQESKVRAYADSGRAVFEEQLSITPNEPQLNMLAGLCLAYLGKKAEAIRLGEKGVANREGDGFEGQYYRFLLTRIYILTGEHEKAIAMLEPLVTKPFYLSRDWLKIDPALDGLRSERAFHKIVAGS